MGTRRERRGNGGNERELFPKETFRLPVLVSLYDKFTVNVFIKINREKNHSSQ